jgi:MoxR-like ATPase
MLPRKRTPMRQKFQKMMTELERHFVGRENEIRGVVLALLAGEHAFLLGPPGTGKSALLRAVVDMVGCDYFGWLMNQFSTPEDILGPVSFSGLQKDQYHRVFDGKLPKAEIAFLDEIWKATVIHNILLTALNERCVADGAGFVPIPLRSMYCASNELPQSGQGLEAIYDRILLRFFVRELSADEMVTVLMNPLPSRFPQILTMADVRAAQTEIEQVAITPDTLAMLRDVRVALEAEGLSVSTRRYGSTLKVLRAMAWLDGDTSVMNDQFGVLADMLWRTPEERPKVVEVVNRIAMPTRLLVQEMLDAMLDAFRKFPAYTQANKAGWLSQVSDLVESLKVTRKKMLEFGKDKAAVKAGVARLDTLQQELTEAIMVATTGRSTRAQRDVKEF